MAETPVILELEQVHRCVSRDASEKVPGAKIRWLSTLSIDSRSVTNLFEAGSATLPGVLGAMRSLREVREARVVHKGPERSWISVRAERGISTAPKLSEAGVVWLQPMYSEGGVDIVTMLAPTYAHFRRFLAIVEGEYDIKVRSKHFLRPSDRIGFDAFSSSGFMQLKAAAELLTARQYETFDLACRHGYYEEPKRISVQELGAKLGVGESTCAELLRKAERKLMPLLNDVLRAMI